MYNINSPCIKHKKVLERSFSLLNAPSPKSSGNLLLYSLPHCSFSPFFVLIFRFSLRKHYEENKEFLLSSCFNGWANSNQQILQFLYGTSSLIVSSLLWKVKNEIGIWFLSQNSRADRKIKWIRDKIREIILKYLFCIHLDTREERNWAMNFSK